MADSKKVFQVQCPQFEEALEKLEAINEKTVDPNTKADKDKTISVITPQAFGAKADGNTDDTNAIQAALTAAASSGKAVYLTGSYKITSELSVPDNSTIIGDSKYGTTILNYSTSTFNQLKNVLLQNVRFTNNAANATFVTGKTHQASMIGCSVAGYNIIFSGGIEMLSRIEDNSFTSIGQIFTTYITDSEVLNNYINASKLGFGSTIAFKGSINTSVISGNYIDFWTVVIAVNSGTHSIISNNRIDDCFTVFLQHAFFFTITGNTFTNITYEESNWKSGSTYYVPQEYRTVPWCIFRFNYKTDALIESVYSSSPIDYRTPWCYAVTFTANTLSDEVDYLIYLQKDENDVPIIISYPVYSIRIAGNSIDPRTLCEFRAAKSAKTGQDYNGNTVQYNFKNVFIETLDRQFYDNGSLPNPTQQGDSRTNPVLTYNGQQAYVNNRLITNIGGTWYYADGSTVSNPFAYESTDNRVSSFSNSPSDTKYPTEKLVYDQLALKADANSIPSNVSAFTNDAGYLTISTLPVYSGGVQ